MPKSVKAYWADDGSTRGWCFVYGKHEGVGPDQWGETECGPDDLTDDRIRMLAREYAAYCGAQDYDCLPVEIDHGGGDR